MAKNIKPYGMGYEILFIQAATESAIDQERIIVDTLRAELGERFTIHHPPMPDADNPQYATWKTAIKTNLQNVSGQVILLGHSLGGSIIVKHFSQEQVPENVIGILLFGIPFWGPDNWDVDEFAIDKDEAENLCKLENIYIYHSLDDEVVPFRHLEPYRKLLPNARWKVLSGIDHSYHGAIKDMIKDIGDLAAAAQE